MSSPSPQLTACWVRGHRSQGVRWRAATALLRSALPQQPQDEVETPGPSSEGASCAQQPPGPGTSPLGVGPQAGAAAGSPPSTPCPEARASAALPPPLSLPPGRRTLLLASSRAAARPRAVRRGQARTISLSPLGHPAVHCWGSRLGGCHCCASFHFFPPQFSSK